MRTRFAMSPDRFRATIISVTIFSVATLLLPLLGCTVVQEEVRPVDPFPGYLPRREIEDYIRIREIILDDGGQRWVVTPNAVLEFNDGFLGFEYGADEGLLGSVLSVYQDLKRLWIGTTRGVQSLDKGLHYVRTYVEDPDMQAVFVSRFAVDECVALTSRGVGFINAGLLTTEIYPLEGFQIREVNDVALFEGDLWVATRRGLMRFSLTWKSWNQAFGSKMLKRLGVIRLERVEERIGDRIVAVQLYAITAEDLFIYRPGFDNWERLGL